MATFLKIAHFGGQKGVREKRIVNVIVNQCSGIFFHKFVAFASV